MTVQYKGMVTDETIEDNALNQPPGFYHEALLLGVDYLMFFESVLTIKPFPAEAAFEGSLSRVGSLVPQEIIVVAKGFVAVVTRERSHTQVSFFMFVETGPIPETFWTSVTWERPLPCVRHAILVQTGLVCEIVLALVTEIRPLVFMSLLVHGEVRESREALAAIRTLISVSPVDFPVSANA